MKKPLLALAFAPAMLMAQQSLSVVFSFKAKSWSPVTVVAETLFVKDALGIKGFDLDALAFVGARLQERRAPAGTAGGAIAWQPQITSNLRGQVGIVGRIEAGSPVATGVLLGVQIRF